MGKGKLATLSTPSAFICSTTPSSAVFRISGGLCCGNVSLKWAEEKSLRGSERGCNRADCECDGVNHGKEGSSEEQGREGD